MSSKSVPRAASSSTGGLFRSGQPAIGGADYRYGPTVAVWAKRGRSASNAAFLMHSATGLWLTTLVAVVMVAATITVLFAEIDELVYPEMHMAPAEDREHRSIRELAPVSTGHLA